MNLQPFDLKKSICGAVVMTRDGRKVTDIHVIDSMAPFNIRAAVGDDENYTQGLEATIHNLDAKGNVSKDVFTFYHDGGAHIYGGENGADLMLFIGSNGLVVNKVVSIEETPYFNYNSFDWAMYFIEHYGQIDGVHHKLWVMDQVARIHKGAEIEITLRKWDNGLEEYSVELLAPTDDYHEWVQSMRFDKNGEESDYKIGIAP